LGLHFDAVIDEVNTMPFFTPLWAAVPVFMLIFQLAREVWWYESPFPVNAIGYLLEPLYLRIYRHTPVMTISKSTESDLRRLGFSSPITIVPIGIEQPIARPPSKPETPTFLYVGRLAPSKRIEHMIDALARFRERTGAGTLWLVGTVAESYEQALRQRTRRLSIDSNVVFWGRLSPGEKQELMSRASALLMTSAREGWGLVVTEANACRTPAIVYDVPGLRDSVRHEITGLVVSPNQVQLAAAMQRLTTEPGLRERLADQAQTWSSTFTFDNSARVAARVLEGVPV
jgi:glycosyltransferase involved in cell wall biosynthesis